MGTPIWMGGEPNDFPNGAVPGVYIGNCRPIWARCAVGPPTIGAIIKSMTFAPQTSYWLSFRQVETNSTAGGYLLLGGLGKSGTSSGLFVSRAFSSTNKIALCKMDAGVITELAYEPGASYVGIGVPRRFDIQVVNYGASATVNIWMDYVPMLSFTGNVAATGVTNLDQFWGFWPSSNPYWYSEIGITPDDSRGYLGFANLYLTAMGALDQWNGSYSTIAGPAISDVSPNYSNTVGQDQQFVPSTLPTGIFTPAAVRLVMRAAASSDATPTKIAMGYQQGGTVNVGTPKVLTNFYAPYDQIDSINPKTGVAWTMADIAAMQLNLRSAA